MNAHDRQIWSARLDGPIFEKDNLVVHRALHNLLISTSGFPWFEQAPDGDGRASFKALTDHYKGPAHQNLSAVEADAILETLHWRNEFVYPFNTYLTNLTKVFKSKQDANKEVPETVKVKEMLKRMKTDNPAVLASMALVRLKHPDDFKSAGEEMATQIAQIFPRSKHEREKSGYTRNRKVAAMERDGKRVCFENDGQGGCGGRGGRGGRGNNRNKNYLNGVDVSDPSRWKSCQVYYLNARQGSQKRWSWWSRRRGKGRGGRGKRNVSSATQDDSDQQESNKGSQNGSSFGRGSHKDNQESRLVRLWSVVLHLPFTLWKLVHTAFTLVGWYGGRMNRTKLPRWMVVAPVTTRRRIMDTRRVAVMGIHDPTHHTDQGHMARCKLDSHADTCVLGSNFKLIELTGEVVHVVPYHEEYDEKKDVPILSAATAWTPRHRGNIYFGLPSSTVVWQGGCQQFAQSKSDEVLWTSSK